MRTVWKNAMMYNPADTEIHQTAKHLQHLFEKRLARVVNKRFRKHSSSGVPADVNDQEKLEVARLVSKLSDDSLNLLLSTLHSQCPHAVVFPDETAPYDSLDRNTVTVELNLLDDTTFRQVAHFVHLKTSPPERLVATAAVANQAQTMKKQRKTVAKATKGKSKTTTKASTRKRKQPPKSISTNAPVLPTAVLTPQISSERQLTQGVILMNNPKVPGHSGISAPIPVTTQTPLQIAAAVATAAATAHVHKKMKLNT
jgi:hypothetical protein